MEQFYHADLEGDQITFFSKSNKKNYATVTQVTDFLKEQKLNVRTDGHGLKEDPSAAEYLVATQPKLYLDKNWDAVCSAYFYHFFSL